MPPMDEDGSIIGMDDLPYVLRGDDGKEYILPGSIPEATLADGEDPEEHDFLPPLEHPADVAWFLSEEASKKLLELFEAEERLSHCSLRQNLQEIADSMGATLEERDPPPRLLRKRIRWDERNRRRELKGLQKKDNPYYGSHYFTITIHVNQPVKSVEVVLDGLTKGQAEDMERIVQEVARNEEDSSGPVIDRGMCSDDGMR